MSYFTSWTGFFSRTKIFFSSKIQIWIVTFYLDNICSLWYSYSSEFFLTLFYQEHRNFQNFGHMNDISNMNSTKLMEQNVHTYVVNTFTYLDFCRLLTCLNNPPLRKFWFEIWKVFKRATAGGFFNCNIGCIALL